jgi:hypothetical protein
VAPHLAGNPWKPTRFGDGSKLSKVLTLIYKWNLQSSSRFNPAYWAKKADFVNMFSAGASGSGHRVSE